MSFNLNPRSEANLKGVHPSLVAIIRGAAATAPANLVFIVTQGVRSVEQQRQYVAAGASETMRSRHIPESNACKLACAVDLAVMIGDEVRWDWPLYTRLAQHLKATATSLGIPLEWGGDWTRQRDGPHFQLPWAQFP